MYVSVIFIITYYNKITLDMTPITYMKYFHLFTFTNNKYVIVVKCPCMNIR